MSLCKSFLQVKYEIAMSEAVNLQAYSINFYGKTKNMYSRFLGGTGIFHGGRQGSCKKTRNKSWLSSLEEIIGIRGLRLLRRKIRAFGGYLTNVQCVASEAHPRCCLVGKS